MDGRVRRSVGPVGVSFGGRLRVTSGGKVWVGGVASGDVVWLVGVVPFMVSNGGGAAVATLGVGVEVRSQVIANGRSGLLCLD